MVSFMSKVYGQQKGRICGGDTAPTQRQASHMAQRCAEASIVMTCSRDSGARGLLLLVLQTDGIKPRLDDQCRARESTDTWAA